MHVDVDVAVPFNEDISCEYRVIYAVRTWQFLGGLSTYPER